MEKINEEIETVSILINGKNIRDYKIEVDFNDTKSLLIPSVSRILNYNGFEIAKFIAELLTDSNFHSLREKIIPIINNELKTDINPIG